MINILLGAKEMLEKQYLATIDIYKLQKEAELLQYQLEKNPGYRIRVFDPASGIYRLDPDDPPDCVISGWGPACGVVDVLHDDIVRYGLATSIVIISGRPPAPDESLQPTVRAVMDLSDISQSEGRQLFHDILARRDKLPPGEHVVIWTAAARREALNEIELDRRSLAILRNVYLSQRG